MADARPALPPRARLRAIGQVAALAAAYLAAAAAGARDERPRTIGGWTIAVSKDGDGCFLTRNYDHPGGTTLLLGLDRHGDNHLSVLNANWSIEPGDRLKLDFRLSGGSYAKHAAIGMASDGKQGFVTRFEAKFPAYFAASGFLHIARGDVPVERLSLNGSGAAIAALRTCVDAQHKAPAGRNARAGDIPKDPFAPARHAKSRR